MKLTRYRYTEYVVLDLFLGQDANPADEKCLIVGRDGMFSLSGALLC
jgi:hypothetical protein